MRRYIIIIFVLLFALHLKAQSFKEIYESMPHTDRFSNMMNLGEYQSLNPDHAICYFKLAEIFDAYMREIDPLLLFDALSSNYNQLYTYYGLVKFKLDDKQARQDREYFGELEIITDKKKVGLADILYEVEKRMESSREYFETARKVHDNYYRFINKYNVCLYDFREILSDYPNYKDLFLLATPRIISTVERMAMNFDSSLVFFDAYKISCAKMPHLLEVNNYTLNPIITYRLEGLIESDFTQANVELWDFNSWATHFLNLINTDIINIRKGMYHYDDALSDKINQLLEQDLYSDSFESCLVDLKFQNLIGKYDHSSLCNELIDYKKSKMKFALNTRREMNDPNDSVNFFLINKLRFYKELATENEALNKEVLALKASTSIDDIAKYIGFFGKQYKGMDAFMRWCEVETYRNRVIFNENLINLNKFIAYDTQRYDYRDSLLNYKNLKIPFGVQNLVNDSLSRDTVVTESVLPFAKRWFYLKGFQLDADSVRNDFIAKVSPRGMVDWLVYPKLKENKKAINTKVKLMQQTTDSICYVLSKSEVQANDTLIIAKNFIDSYSWEGEHIHQFSYDSNLIPVYYWIDEINDQYLLIEQGIEKLDSLNFIYPMSVKLFSRNDSLIWEKHINLKGELLGVIHTNSNFLITCNYNELKIDDQFLECKNNEQGIASFYVTREGLFTHVNDYKTDGNLRAGKCFKISNNTFNFIGTIDSHKNEREDIFYLLVNEKGIPEFSNIDDWEHHFYELQN